MVWNPTEYSPDLKNQHRREKRQTMKVRATVHVAAGRQRKLVAGSRWVYRNEIESIEGEGVDGGLARVVDARGRWIGLGLVNTASVITVRLLSYRDEPIDEEWMRQRVRRAVAYRAPFRRADTDGARLLFGEADDLPGVVADRFGPAIVMQIHALGMERWAEILADELIALEQPETLIFAHEDPIRTQEGLPLYRRVFHGPDLETVPTRENGLVFQVDLRKGQKTGSFLDQKANHRFLRRFAAGRSVLDAFTYAGGFALHAAAAGAARVEAVDISPQALASARVNARENGFHDIRFVEANAFDHLRGLYAARERFDVVVLDPPAFASSHKARAGATRGYKEINLSAMRLLPAGGLLATHSCSFHMPETLFVQTVLSAAYDLRRQVRMVALRRQDLDHPILPGHPESYYLKSLWLQMLD